MSPATPPLRTTRLSLRELTGEDSGFILGLLNDPDFLQYIGDRGVRDLDGAALYITNGPQASYQAHGYGLWRVGLLDDDTPIGICGLLKRDALPAPDLGFAFLPQFRARGLAREAAQATLDWGWDSINLGQVLAITTPGNDKSVQLLQRLGFGYERLQRMPGDSVDLQLYSLPRPPR